MQVMDISVQEYEYRADEAERSRRGYTRWFQLIIGIVCMAMIANLQ